MKSEAMLVVLVALCVTTVASAEDVATHGAVPVIPVPGPAAGAPTRPVVGESAWNEHELRMRRGWVAVEEQLDLRAVDMQALAARTEGEAAQGAEGPSLAADGSIEFVYGEAVPTIFCRPLTICDIALQEGERIVNYTTGTGKGGAWHVGVAVNPVDPEVHTRQPHVVIRPKRQTAEKTTLTVWTDRRAYHFDLVPSEQPMRFVSFRFPEDEKLELLAAAGARSQEDAAVREGEGSGGPFSPRPWEWNRSYEVKCASRFWVCRRIDWMKPEDVSDDGNVTQITLSRDALSQPRPVFHVISPTGQRMEVNYSLHGRTYVVPQIFDEASLIIVNGKRRRHVLEYRIRRIRED